MKSISVIVIALTIFYISPVFAESSDFKNWTYTITDENSVIQGTKFHMENGKWKSRLKRGDLTGEAVEASIDKVRYVDFNSDGEDEIVVQIGVSLVMDTPEVTEFIIIKYDESKIPKQIFNIEHPFSGDFVVDKGKGTMTIEYPDYSNDDPNCCPSLITKDIYQWGRANVKLISKKSYKNK